MRTLAIHLIVYLDDFGFGLKNYLAPSQRYFLTWVITAIQALAGFTVAVSKSCLVPDTKMTLLGFGIDSVRQCFYIPERKLETILESVDIAQHSPTLKLSELQRLTGKLQALSLAIPPISVFLRASYDLLGKAARELTDIIPLSDVFRKDMEDLLSLESWSKLSKWPREQHKVLRLETDASSVAWGAVLYTGQVPQTAGGHFSLIEMQHPIHVKEMLAVRRSLDMFRDALSDVFVDLYVDNTLLQHSAPSGNSVSFHLREFARCLVRFQIETNSVFRIHRVSSEDNYVADTISRGGWTLRNPGSIERGDHRLNPLLFAELQRCVGTPFTVDACANGRNTQVRRFISKTDSNAPDQIATNVFLYEFTPKELGKEFVYCNPPWAIISPLWRHFRLCHVSGVMIVPVIPTRSWYGMLLRDAVGIFTVARQGQMDVFLQPSLGYEKSVGPLPWDLLALRFEF
jgi:hypothetical protein